MGKAPDHLSSWGEGGGRGSPPPAPTCKDTTNIGVPDTCEQGSRENGKKGYLKYSGAHYPIGGMPPGIPGISGGFWVIIMSSTRTSMLAASVADWMACTFTRIGS
jgi:hypothetical protein